MIPQHDAKLARRVRGCLLPVLLAACAPAWCADEQPPVQTPDWMLLEEPQFDPDAPLPEFKTSLPGIDETTSPQAPPIPPGPDYHPPAVDAYVDLSFNQSTVDRLGFSDGPGGYRFVAGWRLEDVGGTTWSVAPEVGYTRLGESESTVITLDRNSTYAGYDTTTTDRSTLDASSLDFGARLGYRSTLAGIGGYLRAGVGFYHAARRDQQSLYSVSNSPGTAGGVHDGESSYKLASSTSDAGVSPFAAVGLTLLLGQVPELYVEYGTRRISGELVNTGALGFLLNF